MLSLTEDMKKLDRWSSRVMEWWGEGICERLPQQSLRNLHTKLYLADSARENEPDLSRTDFFIETHRGHKLKTLSGAQFQLSGQACSLEQAVNSLHVNLR